MFLYEFYFICVFKMLTEYMATVGMQASAKIL